MRHMKRTITMLFVFAGVPSVAVFADTEKAWSGEGLLCASGNANWSNGNNWSGGTAPTANAVVIGAAAFCGDTCDFCNCAFGTCFGGPRDGLSCGTTEDCDCCTGASLVAIYDYTEGANPDHTFSSVSVEASASYDMTLQKSADNPFYATTEIRLVGDATHKAILDVDDAALRPTDLTACKTAEIDVLTGKTLSVLDELIAGCSTADTTLTVKGGGNVDVSSSGNYTRVNAFGTTRSSTLKLDGSVTLQPRNLEIFGGSSASYYATFWHYGTSASIGGGTLTGLKMRAYSKLDVDRNVSYTVENAIDVDTSGVTTDAHVYMYSNSTSIAADNLNVTAGASHAATLTMETGILDVNPGTVTIGADGASQVAKLKIASGAADPVLDDVVIKERGVFELRDSLILDGILTIGEGADNADVVTPANENLVADVIAFKKTTTFTPALASGSVIATD